MTLAKADVVGAGRIRFADRRIVEFALALLLLVAAGLKAHKFLADSPPVIPTLMHHRILVAGLIQVELLLSLWLLVGGFDRIRFGVTIACFSIFGIVAGFETLQALPSCGCLGDVKIRPAITTSADLIAVIVLAYSRARAGHTFDNLARKPAKSAIVAVIFVASCGLWSGYLRTGSPAISNQRTRDLTVLEPEKWLNEPFAFFDEIDRSEPLKSNRWVLVFYDYDCDNCLEAIPKYEDFASSRAAKMAAVRVAFVAMPPLAPPGADPVGLSSDFLHLALRTDRDWFATTPVVVLLNGGRVVETKQGNQAINPSGFYALRSDAAQ